MAVQVQAQGGGGAKVSLGGGLSVGQLGAGSPAMWSAALFLVLLAIVVMVAVSLR